MGSPVAQITRWRSKKSKLIRNRNMPQHRKQSDQTSGRGDQQNKKMAWQHRETDKVKTHKDPPGWHHPSNTQGWQTSSNTQGWQHSATSQGLQHSSKYTFPSSSWQQTPPGLISNNSPSGRNSYWPSFGNTSTSPISHKFSGMGMRDLLNVTLAQEMSSLGMGGSCAPMDLRVKQRSAGKQ